jgi:cation:H+ antiporter
LLLILSSRALVWGAVNIATSFGVSSLVIGLTIIALGTSLPELAASIAASRKGHSDLVLGNILGSNAFNLMSVLGISALISPAQLETAVLTRDIPVMCVITFLFWAFAFKIRGSGMIGRVKGAILLSLYAGYQVLLYFAATQVS